MKSAESSPPPSTRPAQKDCASELIHDAMASIGEHENRSVATTISENIPTKKKKRKKKSLYKTMMSEVLDNSGENPSVMDKKEENMGIDDMRRRGLGGGQYAKIQKI